MTGNGYVDIEDTDVSLGINGFSLTFSQQSYLVNCTVKSSRFTSKFGSIVINANQSCLYNFEIDQVLINHSVVGIDFEASNCINKSTPLFSVSNSNISHNSGKGLNVKWLGDDSGILLIKSSNFIENVGIVLEIKQKKQSSLNNDGNVLEVILKDLKFQQNKQEMIAGNLEILKQSAQSIIYFEIGTSIHITDCAFTDNIGSAMVIYDSIVTFSGNNTFMNNTGLNGGGLFITGGGYIVLSSQAHLYFINNHAEHNGGAIYVEQLLLQLNKNNKDVIVYCFYQLQKVTGINKVFEFQNNTAGAAGSAVYAGGLDQCISITNGLQFKRDFSLILAPLLIKQETVLYLPAHGPSVFVAMS